MSKVRLWMPWSIALVACGLAVLALSQATRIESRAREAAQLRAWMEAERARTPATPTPAASAADVRDALGQSFGAASDIAQRGKRLTVQLNAMPTDRALVAIQELERGKRIPVRTILLKTDGIARLSGSLEVDAP